MGAAQPSRVTPLLPESYAALTNQDVAAQVSLLGKAFEGYAEKAELRSVLGYRREYLLTLVNLEESCSLSSQLYYDLDHC